MHSDLAAHFPWADRVLSVRAVAQMKWWYVKRFLSPAVVAPYRYVIVVDDDCDVRGLDPPAFVRELERWRVRIGQPAHAAGSFQPQYPILRQRLGANVSGSWTTFVESGPLVAFSAAAWPCVWTLLQPDLGSGYGYDLVWAPACAEGRAAVLHTHAIMHANHGAASSTRPNWVGRAIGEAFTLFERLAKRSNASSPSDADHGPPQRRALAPVYPRRIADFGNGRGIAATSAVVGS